MIRGSIKVIKTDKDRKTPLAGVEFGLYDKDKNQLTTLTTDKDVIILFDALTKSVYYVKETKAFDWPHFN